MLSGRSKPMTELFSETDRLMMRRALDLAALGVGQVSPSPLVGCVVVDSAGDIAGEGTFLYENVTHAEVLALDQAGTRARGGTAYVSLEPHSYHGRTRPCTTALIEAGIKRVVCPIEDPNPLVSGAGFAQLREAGIDVAIGLFRAEATRLNEKFCVWHYKKRPFVHLKLAVSLDGRISLRDSVSTRLSGEESSARVQLIRHEHDAILVGGNTAFVDDPSLTDRSGHARRRPLARVVLDNRLRLPVGSRLASTTAEAPTMVFSDSDDEAAAAALNDAGVEVVRLNARDLASVLEELRRREIQSVLVEGGTEIAGAFCDAGLVDKITLIVAPLIIGGHDAPVAIGGRGAFEISAAMKLVDLELTRFGDDFEITGYPSNLIRPA